MSAFKRQRTEPQIETEKDKLWAKTIRSLPEDLAIAVGLRVHKQYEQELQAKEDDIRRLEACRQLDIEHARLEDVRAVLFKELEAAHETLMDDPSEPVLGSLPIRKQLMELNDWITLERLFDEETVDRAKDMEADRFLYHNFVLRYSDDADSFMDEFFQWSEYYDE